MNIMKFPESVKVKSSGQAKNGRTWIIYYYGDKSLDFNSLVLLKDSLQTGKVKSIRTVEDLNGNMLIAPISSELLFTKNDYRQFTVTSKFQPVLCGMPESDCYGHVTNFLGQPEIKDYIITAISVSDEGQINPKGSLEGGTVLYIRGIFSKLL